MAPIVGVLESSAMPVRRRESKRATRARFEITPKIAAAFENYINSPAQMGGGWQEHWTLHDALNEIGALDLPLVPPCCWHPDLKAAQFRPEAIAIYQHLNHTRP
ncbi:hypothetical protein VBH83_13935 [Ochrobactrum sp. S1502_03]